MNSDTDDSDVEIVDVEMDSESYEMMSSDEEESEAEQIIELDLIQLPKSKAYECCTLDKIQNWFEDLVSYLEKRRTRDKLPLCPKISAEILIKLNFDASEISSIYNKSIDERIQKDIILECVGIKEPKKEFEIPMEESDCNICYCEGFLQSTGFCNHMYCDDCLSHWFESKIKENKNCLIECMHDDCKYIYGNDIVERQIQTNAKTTDKFQKIFEALITQSKMPENTLPWILIGCQTPDCPIYFRINKEIKATNFNMSLTLKCDHCRATFCSDFLLSTSKPPLIPPSFLDKNKECPCHRGHEPIACAYLGEFANFKAKNQVIKKREVDNSNAEFIKNRTRDCPRCGTKVFRDEGCDHMRCLCGQAFCWRCKYKYTRDHEHHRCDLNERQEGRFEVEYIEITKTLEDENKIPHKEIVNAIDEREDDLRILRFKFEGLNVDELSVNDSGNESDSEIRDDADLKRMAQFDDLVKSRIKAKYKFWYPKYFLTTNYLKPANATIDNSKLHVFDYAFDMAEDLIKRLETANRTTGHVLKFCFFLKRSETSTQIVKTFREDMIGFFNKAVTLGKQTGTYISVYFYLYCTRFLRHVLYRNIIFSRFHYWVARSCK